MPLDGDVVIRNTVEEAVAGRCRRHRLVHISEHYRQDFMDSAGHVDPGRDSEPD